MNDTKALSILFSLITIALSAWTVWSPEWWRLGLVFICWLGVMGLTVVNMEHSR
jgi:hypothetical protein